jgi:hypothetical protein
MFFSFVFSFYYAAGKHFRERAFLGNETRPAAVPAVIGRRVRFGCNSATLFTRLTQAIVL